MPRSKTKVYTPSNVSATYFISNATGATWTLTNTATPDNLAHKVSIHNDSATDHSGKTALLTGTDENGNNQTETLALPGSSATVTSTKYFQTLTSVIPSATIGADTMDIGYTSAFISQWFLLNYHDRQGRASFVCTVTGTINYTVQQTQDNIYDDTYSAIFANIDDTTLVNATTSQNGGYETTPVAIRIVINSYSSGASLRFDLLNTGYRQV